MNPVPARMQATLQATFAGALLDAARPVPAGLIGPDGRPSARRFGVYRNNVVSGLTNALRDAYPVVARLVGDEFFAAMARVFVTSHPPASPVMLDYGGGFARFVDGFEPATGAVPYLGDVARIERAWLEAYHSREARALCAGTLAALSAEALMGARVTLHPSLRVVRSLFPVLTVWRSHLPGSEPGWIDLACGGQDVLIVRPEADVELRSLPVGSGAFIEALHTGRGAADAATPAMARSMGEAMESAMTADSRFDLSVTLSGLVEAGGIVALTLATGRTIR